MWTITKLTSKEIISKRIFLITIIMTFVFLCLYGTAIYFAAKESADIVADEAQGTDAILMQQFFASQLLGIGLYFSSFITALLAILSSVSAISGEVSSHQIDTWLMRPISRSQFVFGKFIGLALLMVGYAVGLFLSILLLHQGIGGDLMALDIKPMQVIKAVSVFAIQPFVLIGFGLLLSTRMTTLNAGIVAIIMYGAAFIGGFIEQIGALIEKTSLENTGIIMSLVFPIDSMYRKMTILLFDTTDNPLSFAQGGMFTSVSSPSNVMVWYAVIYGVIAVLLSIYSFKRRDV
ncbi:ABC transporter permease subunit [Sediminibacillus massiliensis]|uniref:ABC transporter permease subunit n=1 Tax=Sediminibacillus massiliensis TaxID=1926277 RepID=UPI000988800D|nr:ABC transporter permease subunit [Sediminibacillus massiliensis]